MYGAGASHVRVQYKYQYKYNLQVQYKYSILVILYSVPSTGIGADLGGRLRQSPIAGTRTRSVIVPQVPVPVQLSDSKESCFD